MRHATVTYGKQNDVSENEKWRTAKSQENHREKRTTTTRRWNCINNETREEAGWLGREKFSSLLCTCCHSYLTGDR